MPFTLTMPKLSPTMEEGTIAKWHKSVGDYIKVGEVLLEVATDKATVEYEAIDEGWLRQILIGNGKVARVNQPIAVFTETKEESLKGYEVKEEKAPAPVVAKKEEGKKSQAVASTAVMTQPSFAPEPPLEDYRFSFAREEKEKRVVASPLARKVAKEEGLDIASVKGSGPAGRVVKDDLKLAASDEWAFFHTSTKPNIAPGTYEEEPLSPMRKIIGQRLQESKSFIPHFYVKQEIDVGALVGVYEELKGAGFKISYNDFMVRACALALREVPEVNAGYYAEKQAILRFKTIDIAVAVSVEGGLVTPIVRHADYKNIGELSVEIKALVQKARSGKLVAEEYKGGSFTVSNLGMYAITDFQAIINPPQAAILAIGGILDRPMVKEEKVVPGKVMTVTLSADHRVIDGVAAARFLDALKKFVESPSVLLI